MGSDLPLRSPQRLLYRAQELNFRTQYAELKERASQVERLLPGSPGVLTVRTTSAGPYVYRVFQEASGKQAEEYVAREDDEKRAQAAAADIEWAKWVATQVRALRKLDFQVADKAVARVLVELYNSQLLHAGLYVVGTLAYMAWLNELGVKVAVAQTQDLDFGTPRDLKLAASRSFLDIMQRTKLGFNPVPGLSPAETASSVKLPGAHGLRVDVLTSGDETGQRLSLPALNWAAQTVEHYDYLLGETREGAVLAGTHCIPVRLPAVERFVWHKFFSSIVRKNFPEKAAKDREQALLLTAVLCDRDEDQLLESAQALPQSLRDVLAAKRDVLLRSAQSHEGASRLLRQALGTA
jgi:hypothetical protein